MSKASQSQATEDAPSEPLAPQDGSPAPDAQALQDAAAGEAQGPLGAMTVPAEGAELPGAPAKLTKDTLPDGYTLVEGEPKGIWSQLLDDDGKPVKVDGKFVSVEGAYPTVAHPA